MKRLESNQTEQSWFCCSIHYTGGNCRWQDFRTVPFIYLIQIYHYIHFDQASLPGTVYTKYSENQSASTVSLNVKKIVAVKDATLCTCGKKA